MELRRSFAKWGFLISFFTLFSATQLQAQTDTLGTSNDSVRVTNAPADTLTIIPQRHSPRRALMLSAIVPGAGQAYNKKYWKIPIIYAGAGVLGFLSSGIIRIILSGDAFIALNGPSGAFILDKEAPEYQALYSRSRQDQLDIMRRYRDYNRRNFEFCIILSGVLYALNIVDANVDAHLKNFQLGDNDLSLVPSSSANQPGVGLSCGSHSNNLLFVVSYSQ